MSTPDQARLSDVSSRFESEPQSELSRLAGIFGNPKHAFEDIVQRPHWYVPIILSVLAGICLIALYSQHVGFARLIQQSLDQNPRTQSMSPEQRNQAFQMGLSIGKPMAYVSALVAPPASVLVIGAVLMLMTNTFLGAEIHYSQMIAITAYSMLPTVVAAVLAMVVMFLRSPEDFDLRNPLAFNLGALLSSESTPKWLVVLGTSIDVFSFWMIALLATGIVVASRKLSWSRALIAVLLPWAILVLLKVGWAAIFS